MRIKKTSQTTPIQAEVVNTYSDSTEDTYSCDYLNGEILYDNTNGTTGDVTLSDSASNYRYLEIFFKNVDSFFNSVKVYEPNNKDVSLTSVVTFTGGTGIGGLIAIHGRNVNINGTSISTINNTSNGTYYGALALWENQNASLDKTNYIYITKVIGYK